MAEITVDVGVRLQAMQSSVADLQRALDKLQPNSSGFKDLQKIISNISSNMDKLRLQSSKPFGSQNQFNQTEKTVEKLEDSLERAKLAIERIKFSDLKLDVGQVNQLDNFKDQLKNLKQDFIDFKNNLKTQFLSNDFNKAFIDSINPNLINKTFDDIVKNVQSKTDSLGKTLANVTNDLNELQKASNIGKKIDDFSKNGVTPIQGLGQELYNNFFQNNAFSLSRGEIQKQFIEYLKKEFQLTPGQVDQLIGLPIKEIKEKLSTNDFFDIQKIAAEKANKKLPQTTIDFSNASANYENAIAVVQRLAPLLEALSNKNIDLAEKERLVNQALVEFQNGCTGSARSSQTTQHAISGLTSQLNGFKQQLNQVNVQWLRLQNQQNTFNSMKMAITNFMGFNQVLNLTKRAVKDAMNHIKQLDATMNGISIVTDMTTADLWKQVDAYSALAQKYGTTIQGAYDISKIYYQQGLETKDVMVLTEETLKLSKVSGLDYAKATDYMTTALRGFKMEMQDAAKVVDVYSNLAANTAVSQEELAIAMSKTASSLESVHATFEESSAMIATMVAVTRESATNIGSALKSIASRYGELTKDPKKLIDSEGEAMSFNKVDAALQSVGISMQTTDHQFREFTDVIVELSEKWDTLDSTQQRYIATQFAGNRQQSRFLALVSNGDLLKENIETAQNSEDIGTIQALKAMDSIESKMNQLQVAAQQFYTTLGAEGVWKSALTGVTNYINTLNNLPKLFGKIPIGAIGMVSSLIHVVKTAMFNVLSEAAKIWKQILDPQANGAAVEAQAGAQTAGESVGQAATNGLVSGMKSISGGLGLIFQPLTNGFSKIKDTIGGFFNNKQSITSQTNKPIVQVDADTTQAEAKINDIQNKASQPTAINITSEQIVNALNTIEDVNKRLRELKNKNRIEVDESEVKKLKEELQDALNLLEQARGKGISYQTKPGAAEKKYNGAGISKGQALQENLNDFGAGVQAEHMAADLTNANQQANELNNKLKELNQLPMTSMSAIKNDLTEANIKVQQLEAEYERLKDTSDKVTLAELRKNLDEAKASAEQLESKLRQSIATSANKMQGLASALNMISGLFNQATAGGRALAGSFQLAAGAASALAAILLGINNSNFFLAAASAIVFMVNGISTIIETAEERAERLAKTAEELTNKAKEQKANYNILDRSINKLQELEKARYDSAEAAEEYQTAVDDLVEKYPQLITGLDAVGNATIEAANLDYELEKARKAAAEATLAAAKAEREKAENDLKNAEEKINGLRTDTSYETLGEISGNKINELQGYSFSGHNDLDRALKNIFDNTGQEGLFTSDEQGVLEYLYQELFLIGKQGEQYIKQQNLGSGYFKYSLEQPLENIRNLFSDDSLASQIIEKYSEALQNNISVDANTDIIDFGKKIQNLDNLKDDEKKFKEEIEQLSQNTNELIREAFPQFFDFASEYLTGLEGVENFKDILKATEKTELSAAINNIGKEQQEFVESLGDASGILTAYVYKLAEGKDIEEYIKNELSDDYQRFQESYKIISASNVKTNQFQDMWKNRQNYTAEDFYTKFGLDSSGDPLGIFAYYEQNMMDVQTLRDRLFNKTESMYLADGIYTDFEKAIEDLRKTIKITNLSTSLAKFITDAVDQAQTYFEKGFIDKGEAVLKATNAVIEAINTEGVDTGAINALIQQYGISNISSISNIIKNLPENTPENVETAFKALGEALLYNLPLAIESYTDELVSQIEDIEGKIKKTSSGMSVSEAVQALELVNQNIENEQDQFHLTDFTKKNGKLAMKSDLRQKYIEAILNGLEQDYNAINDDIAKFTDSEKINGYYNELLSITKDSDLTKTPDDILYLLDSLQLIEKDEDGNYKFTKEVVDNTKSVFQIVDEMLKQRATNAQEAYEYAQKELPAAAALESGDYKKYFSYFISSSAYSLKDIASGKTKEISGMTYEQVKPVREKLNSVYDSLISDAFSKGLENLDARDYEGLINDSFNVGEEGPHRYQEFITRYAAIAGKSVEETNELIIQAIEKDSKNIKVTDALKDITFTGAGGIRGSREAIEALANSLNVHVDQILGAYDAATETYAVVNIDWSKVAAIDNNLSLIVDSMNDFFSAINEALSKGLKGTLTFAERDEFISQLKMVGINIPNIESMFIQTADGLKLSQSAALTLYSTMKGINSLAAQTTLDVLVESAKDADESLNNVYNVMERIDEINEELSNTKLSDTRRKQLEAELDIAKQIHQELASSDNTYNFMKNKLPSSFDDPMSAWEGMGDAFKVLDGSDFKKGRIAYEDFYNMITAMGDEGLKAAGLFNDKIDSAADLIEAASGALKNVNGETIVDLSALGTGFKIGAKNMKEGLTEGIHQLAKNQIAMLDAEIAMLETIVQTQEAFESIDSDENKEIDVSELLPHIIVTPSGIKAWDDKGQSIWRTLKDLLGKDFSLDGVSIEEILSDPNLFEGLDVGTQQMWANIMDKIWNIDINPAEDPQGYAQALQDAINEILIAGGRAIEIDPTRITDNLTFKDKDTIGDVLEKKFGDSWKNLDEDTKGKIIKGIEAKMGEGEATLNMSSLIQDLFPDDSDTANSILQQLMTYDVTPTISVENGVYTDANGGTHLTYASALAANEKIAKENAANERGLDILIKAHQITPIYSIGGNSGWEYNGQIYSTKEEALEAWKADNKGTDKYNEAFPEDTFSTDAPITVTPVSITVKTANEDGSLDATENLTTVNASADEVKVDTSNADFTNGATDTEGVDVWYFEKSGLTLVAKYTDEGKVQYWMNGVEAEEGLSKEAFQTFLAELIDKETTFTDTEVGNTSAGNVADTSTANKKKFYKVYNAQLQKRINTDGTVSWYTSSGDLITDDLNTYLNGLFPAENGIGNPIDLGNGLGIVAVKEEGTIYTFAFKKENDRYSLVTSDGSLVTATSLETLWGYYRASLINSETFKLPAFNDLTLGEGEQLKVTATNESGINYSFIIANTNGKYSITGENIMVSGCASAAKAYSEWEKYFKNNLKFKFNNAVNNALDIDNDKTISATITGTSVGDIKLIITQNEDRSYTANCEGYESGSGTTALDAANNWGNNNKDKFTIDENSVIKIADDTGIKASVPLSITGVDYTITVGSENGTSRYRITGATHGISGNYSSLEEAWKVYRKYEPKQAITTVNGTTENLGNAGTVNYIINGMEYSLTVADGKITVNGEESDYKTIADAIQGIRENVEKYTASNTSGQTETVSLDGKNIIVNAGSSTITVMNIPTATLESLDAIVKKIKIINQPEFEYSPIKSEEEQIKEENQEKKYHNIEEPKNKPGEYTDENGNTIWVGGTSVDPFGDSWEKSSFNIERVNVDEVETSEDKPTTNDNSTIENPPVSSTVDNQTTSEADLTLSEVEAELVDATNAVVTADSSTINVADASILISGLKTNNDNKDEDKNDSGGGSNAGVTPEQPQDIELPSIDIGDLVSNINDIATALANSASVIKEAINQIPTADTAYQNISKLASAMMQIPTSIHKRIENLSTAMGKIKDVSATIKVGVSVAVEGSPNAKGNVKSVGYTTGGGWRVTTNSGGANLSVALAKGANTLMGELGTELIVADGRYYTVGEQGAEFVNLPHDAIVFNHLQTKKLLSKGHISGRGDAIHGAKAATSFAKGNALASASATLAQLKNIRAMWQRLLDASAKDLGSQAGRGGGGGGGGGDTDEPTTTTDDIQRWYNWLRQIEHIEMHITEQEKLQTQYENDRIANGEKIYATQKKQYELLGEEIKRNEKLAELQKKWYDNKRKELAESSYGKIFTYDEYGLQQYTGNDMPGSGVGLDILENLTRRNVNGQAIDNAATAKKQLAYLQSVGFNLSDLLYNDDGTKVAKSINKNLKLTKNKGDKSKDNELYTKMMENFWNNVDAWRDELDGLYDSYHEQMEKVIENQNKQNEILQAFIDNELDVEQKLLEAVEAREQAVIDKLEEQKTALEKSNEKYIKGLTDTLNKEKEIRQKNENNTELTKLQRQLAILQRSGGSASQIKSLQDQIQSKQQDAYYEERQQQIDAIQEASDKQIERLDTQIELLKDTLEYQKSNGLLWNEVRQIMAGGTDAAVAFYSTWTGRDESALQQSEDIKDFKEAFQEWAERRDDEKDPLKNTNISRTEALENIEKQNSDFQGLSSESQNKIRTSAKAAGQKAYNEAIEKGQTEEEAELAYRQAYSKSLTNTENLQKYKNVDAHATAAEGVWDNIVENAKNDPNSFVNNSNYAQYGDELQERFIENLANSSELEYDENGKIISDNAILTQEAQKALQSASEGIKTDNLLKENIPLPSTAYGYTFNEGNNKQKTKDKKRYTKLVSQGLFGESYPVHFTGNIVSKNLSSNNTNKGKAVKNVPFLEAEVNGKTVYFRSSDLPGIQELITGKNTAAAFDTAADNTKVNVNDLKAVPLTLGAMTPVNIRDTNGSTYTLQSGVPVGISHVSFAKSGNNIYDVASATISEIAGKVLDKEITLTGGQLGGTNNAALLSTFATKATKKSGKKTVAKTITINKKKRQVWIPKPNYKAYYKQGGMADFTGPAWMDGTIKKPEAVLNAAQTEFLRKDLLGNSSTSLISIVSALQDAINNTAAGTNSTSTTDDSVVIENVSVTFEAGTIASDYDARRAGELFKEELVKIARKAGNNSVSRR